MGTSLTLKEIAEQIGGDLVGDGSIGIQGVGPVATAGPGEIAAVDAERVIADLPACRAGAILVSPRFAEHVTRPHVVVERPQIALNVVIEALGLKPSLLEDEIHETALIHPEAHLGQACAIGPYAVVGRGARLGDRCRVHAHAVIEPGAELGDDCVVLPHAVICGPARLGRRVIVHPGAVVGSEGFGFSDGTEGPVHLHHLGTVEIGDGAEIGAGTKIDRARFGATRIGSQAKLDNLVQIGHNCSIGDRTILAAQVGFAGSSHIGTDSRVGGRVGVKDHVRITDGVYLGASSGVGSDIDEPGQYMGFWAKDFKAFMRELAAMSRLPAALHELREVRKTVAELKARLEDGASGDDS